MSTDFTLPLGPFRDALKTLFGSIFAAIFVTMAGGFVATLLTYWGEMYFSDWPVLLCLGWIGHWVIACMMMWGFLFLVLQCSGLYSLISGSRDPLLTLGLMFCNQVFVSIVALIIYGGDQIEIHRPLIGGGIFFTIMGFALWKMHEKSRCAA